ncbi:neuromedin-B [Arapaima gigas]
MICCHGLSLPTGRILWTKTGHSRSALYESSHTGGHQGWTARWARLCVHRGAETPRCVWYKCRDGDAAVRHGEEPRDTCYLLASAHQSGAESEQRSHSAMAGVSWSRVYHSLLLSYLLLLPHLSVTSSVSLDLTELRNKVAKIKVNPRGSNLWATGHFMGKKSVLDSREAADPDGGADEAAAAAALSGRDVKELSSQEVLRLALQTQLLEPWVQTAPSEQEQEKDLLKKILENFI